jgi:hypothetical protein
MKALSGAARRRLKKANAEASVARTGGTQQTGACRLVSERRNPHRDSKEAKDGGAYSYRNGHSPKTAQGR